MAGDRRDLVCSASDLGEASRGRLTQAMRRNTEASGGITKLAEPIAETGCGIGLAKMRHEERLDAHGRRCLDDLAQLGMQGYFKMCLLAALGFVLVELWVLR